MRDYQIAKQNVESFYAAQQSWDIEEDMKKKRQQESISTHKVRAQLGIEDDILRGLGMCLQQAKHARVRTGALLANLRSNSDCGLKEPLF